jgi:hypothetical protein
VRKFDRGVLVAVSAAHLTVALVSMKIAIARRSSFHLSLLRGDPRRVVRDSIIMGTALSEPVVMMIPEALAIGTMVRGDSQPATAWLGWLGALNVPGYLLERQGRLRLQPSGWDSTETPLVVIGLGLSTVMAKLGLAAAVSR